MVDREIIPLLSVALLRVMELNCGLRDRDKAVAYIPMVHLAVVVALEYKAVLAALLPMLVALAEEVVPPTSPTLEMLAAEVVEANIPTEVRPEGFTVRPVML